MRTPQSWSGARLTLIFAGASAAAWIIASALGLDQAAAIWGGFIPARFDGVASALPLAPLALTPLTAMLVHGGFAHLAFNLLILLFCGRAVETIIGGRQYAALYLIGAYVAAAAHYASDPHSTVPMVGASGAISAVIGAYAMLFGRNRVKVANPTVALWLNALWLAVAWVALQLLIGATFETAGARIAIAAHIGGFLIGLLLAKPLLLVRYRGA